MGVASAKVFKRSTQRELVPKEFRMKSRSLILAVAITFTLAACGGGSSGSGGSGGVTPGGGTSSMSVALIDGQVQLNGITVTAVNLGIDKVEVVGGGNQPTVIQSYSTPNVVNILNYTSQSSALNFSGSIPAGNYSQIRLLLDTATTTISYTQNGSTFTDVPLSIPSATQGGFGNSTSTDSGDAAGTAGVKVNVSLNAQAGSTYAFVLDFNAGQSIIETGGGNFMMKPVIVATAQAVAGSITGTVLNQAGQPVADAEVEATQGGTVVNAGITDPNGNYTINALPAGSYTLVVENTYTTQAGTSVTATGYDIAVGASLTVSTPVTVTAGQSTTATSIAD